MRRRLRSAAFPVHRHSIPQILVDGGLVALAYLLAFNGFTVESDSGAPLDALRQSLLQKAFSGELT